MNDPIELRHVKGGFSLTNPVILHQSPQIRLIFSPNIHKDGVRGILVRQKIGQNGEWEELEKVDFRKAPLDFLAGLELKTEATLKLYDHLAKLYEVQSRGAPRSNQELVVAQKDKVLIIDDANKQKAIQQIMDKGYSEEVWTSLLQTNPDLATRLSMARIQSEKQGVIKQFESALDEHADDESHWQQFFKENPWILEACFSNSVFMLNGEAYLGGKLSQSGQGVGGVVTDFLFSDQSTKSFVVIEIKTPISKLVGAIYRGQVGSGYDNEIYSMGPDLSGGITQAQNQLKVAVENFQTTLGKSFPDKINCVDPRAILIIGNSDKLSDGQRNSFNQFRKGFYSPTIVTFNELLNRLKKLYELNDTTGVDEQPDTNRIEVDDVPF